MNANLLAESRMRSDAIDRIVLLAESASPKLKSRGERMRIAISMRQDRAFARICSRPKSKAYHDYVEIPAAYGVSQ